MAISRRALLAAGAAVVTGACAGSGSGSGGSPRRPSAAPGPTTATTDRPTAALAPFVQTGPSTGDGVALTFHGSGNTDVVTQLLAAASRLDARITVFAVGRWLDDNPTMARRILDGGGELANHTYTHPVLTRLGPPATLDEIVRCRDALERHGGSPGRWFRPSGTPTPTATIEDAARRAGYTTIVGYDVDPLDYQDPGATLVASRVETALHPGAIVSLHTGHPGTVDAFTPIVSAMRRRGLRPVTVSELLGVSA
jgi:peptidoglycan/xylan/chitin deacetylase (PgdA/CDA1 family)